MLKAEHKPATSHRTKPYPNLSSCPVSEAYLVYCKLR